MGRAPFWGEFWNHRLVSPVQREVLMVARDRIHAALNRYGEGAWSLIHADLHPGNVLVGGEALAVIDFDDAAFGWHQYDLAVALVHQHDHSHFADFRDACVRGYRTVRAIPDTDLSLLPMFLLVRRMVQIGWLHQRPELGDPPGLVGRVDRVCAAAAAFEPPC